MRRVCSVRAGLLAAIALGLCAVAPAPAQTAFTAKLVLRPLTRGDIAAFKLPSTMQISAGLTNVGLGEPAYLEVQVANTYTIKDILNVAWTLSLKPSASKATLIDGPLPISMPAYEPSDRAAFLVAGRALLVPDVTGQYVVNVTVTTAKGETAATGQTIVGATYVGIASCTLCHSGGLAENMATSWSKTAHAHLFTDGVNGVASDHYSASCIGCHTVGYDTTAGAVNGGFDDIATKLSWVLPVPQKAGNWEAMPKELQNVANIQCENCHGPGSVHANSGGTTLAISKTLGSGDCAQCHDAPTHHIKNGEWNNSQHAIATRDPSGAGREACVGCHTGPGFLDKVNGVTTPDTTYTPITCQTCHEPHGQTKPDTAAHLVRSAQPVTLADGTKVTDAGNGLLCMNCHQSRQNATVYAATAAASTRFGPHHGPQADMLEGTNGYTYGQVIPTSAHYFVVEDTCVTCHMQTVAETAMAFTHAGGYTFKPSWSGD
ncbi:MAG TPA: hypothetical protein VGF59_16185, partial [Bryobacteraceae bacterium]